MRNTDLLRELTALDKTTLEGGDDYIAYFACLQGVFQQLLDSLRKRTAKDPLEIEILQKFASRFLHSVECMRMKYLCEPERKLRYDPSDSGFPSFIEFKELEHDLEMREQVLRELPAVDVLKQAILDSLFRHKRIPHELLRQLGQREYHLLLSRYSTLGGLFRVFTPGEWQPLQNPEDKTSLKYLYSWGSFDVLTNRPHVYMLVLEQRAGAKLQLSNPAQRQNVEALIAKLSNNTAPLQVIARDLDEALKEHAPKILKRIELGPLYSRFAQGDSFYANILREQFGPLDLVFLFSTEIVFSIGETRSKSFMSAPEFLQIFFVDKSNSETMLRNVSELQQFMIATHGVVQNLHDQHPDRVRTLTLPPITFIPTSQSADAKK